MPRDESLTAVTTANDDSSNVGLYELLTVDEVAALLKVSKSWVYEHTRAPGTPRSERLPHVKIQAYVAHLTQSGYAPKSIDHIHDVLSAVLRTGVKWGHLPENPARGVDLPTLKCVRPKWVLTTTQAGALLEALPLLARTMAGVALLTGLRRGELFALRWKSLDLVDGHLTVQEAVYEGAFGTPKTEAGVRRIPLSDTTVTLLEEWKGHVKRTEPEALIFSTWSAKPISPNNVLRRWIFPSSAQLKLPNATWLTFRRTYSSWAHDKGVPASRRRVDGSREGRHDVERVHTSDRGLGTSGSAESRRRIVHNCSQTGKGCGANSLKDWLLRLDSSFCARARSARAQMI